VSIGDNGQSAEGSRTQYFIGQFDGTTFVNDHDDSTILWLDYGRDNYAGVSWSDIQDGRRIYLGWMSNWRYANQVPTEKWRGAMTLPRELSLAKTEVGIRLFQKPVAEVRKIRKETESYPKIAVESGSTVSIPFTNSLMEITLDFEKVSSSQFGFIIQHSEKEKTVIGYNTVEEKLFVDRTLSGEHSFSTSFPAIQEASLKLDHQRLKLQLFLDTSSIEVFANNGEAAITSLLFPRESSKELILFSNEGTTNVLELNVTELDSIWSK
jgi:fructan beta-fructosidase